MPNEPLPSDQLASPLCSNWHVHYDNAAERLFPGMTVLSEEQDHAVVLAANDESAGCEEHPTEPTYAIANEAGETIARGVADPHAWWAENGRPGDYVVETGEELRALADAPIDGPCDEYNPCSEEYGPCENHGETLVVREGASTRTADESALCLIDDLVENGWGELSPYGADVVDQARTALDSDRWIDPERYPNLAEALYDTAWQVENNAGDVLVIHDDGYRIVRPGPGYWHAIGLD